MLHYGLLYGVEEAEYEFDKHWYQDFNALKCPPWEVPPAGERPKQGLFPFPPRPSSLTSKVLYCCPPLLMQLDGLACICIVPLSKAQMLPLPLKAFMSQEKPWIC